MKITPLYVLCWTMKFSVLEDFILKVIEQNQGCTDADVADILCLSKKNVATIIADDGIKSYVQGDSSRRTLISDFTRTEFAIINNETDTGPRREYCQKPNLDFFQKLDAINHKNLPKSLQKNKANRYYKLDTDIEMPAEIKAKIKPLIASSTKPTKKKSSTNT